ncbi:MAG: ATP-dependent 6-phosphofructokinase [Candidatus Krumholzibacteria bacterium]|nr:ATP-dependent 6-phosphofructokinase [Candidatus Krumholzibacteria bacterium]
MLSSDDFVVRMLGERKVPSPLGLSTRRGDGIAYFVPDDTRVLHRITGNAEEGFDCGVFMQRAGPREKLFFDPPKTRVAMVTCGGLAPGLNNVIRSLFLELHHKYEVEEIIGFKYGFRGMNPAHGNPTITLTNEFVRTVHNEGGSVLGTSRGAEDVGLLVDRLVEMKIDVLFCIGGDGTLRGAHAIWQEIERRRLTIAIVGIPKTIDNDIPFVYKTFGFDTAVGVVRLAIESAHVEAVGTPNGIGLVKVMGRNAGFIAAYGTLASMEANFCLIPEVPFDLRGEGGLLDLIEKRVRERGHALIVVAEGAGQNLLEQGDTRYDASGNKLHEDIGAFLRDEIVGHCRGKDIFHHIKYIDPSYMIRSVKANASDAIFCDDLARAAVHAAMAGKTDCLIGLWHGVYVHLPLELVISQGPRRIHPESFLWRSVVGATGQPQAIRARAV